jgi:predicted PurR-regulated permease PerM
VIDGEPPDDRNQSPGSVPAVTPIWISSRLQVTLIAAALLLLGYAIWLVPGILAIVIGAVALALLLSFPVGWLSRVVPRWLALLLTLMGLLGSIALALAVLLPLLIEQLTDLIAAWPGIQDTLDHLLDTSLASLRARGLLPDESSELADRIRDGVSDRARLFASGLLRGLLSAASGALGFGVRLVAVVIIAIYLLLDVEKLRDALIDLAPTRYGGDVAALWGAFASSISRYLGGVVVVAGITGLASGVALWLLGVPYAILLGVWVAFTSLIPVFGTYLGVVPALPLALAESPTTAVLTILVYIVIQNVQDNLLTPRIQGEVARVHPVVVLLTVLWVGYAFGLVWSVLAVPALVIIRVLFDFFRVRLRVRPG